MHLNIDSTIFILFLSVTMLMGLFSSRSIKNLKEYAIGNRDFSTATIVATLVATWASGQAFFTILSETYSSGLYFIWSVMGYILCLLSIGIFFAPRLSEFLGVLSIAEAMGRLYGKQVRIITAIASLIASGGMVALQLKVSGFLFEYCFGLPEIYGIFIGGVIVTVYSSLGGIKSVTFTDVIQFFTFSTMIPALALFILGTLDNVDILTHTITTNKLFDYKEVFDFTQPKSIYFIFLFLFNAIPAFNPAFFQRIAMARNTAQIGQSFIIAAFTCLFITLTIAFISILLLSVNPNLNTNDLTKYILFNYSYPGLNGFVLAGIMAMVLSTADSYINSTSVLFVNDFCKPLKIKVIKNDLFSSRLTSALLGIISIILALRSGSLLQLLISANMLYMPIVTVPFIVATLGFRTSSKSVLIGMGSGFIVVIIWEFFLKTGDIDGLIPGMVANLIFLIGSHYILKQPRGWVGIKDDQPLREIKQLRAARFKSLKNSVLNFDHIKFLRQNSPNTEAVYVYFGVFCIISLYSTMYAMPQAVKIQYFSLFNFVSPSVLFSATALLSYPLWPKTWKDNKSLISLTWNIIAFYVLICVGFLFVVISNFAPLQVMILMINLILISVLVRWQWALLMMIIGFCAVIQFFNFYLEAKFLIENTLSLQFKVIYLLLLVSSVLIIFVRPKQEYLEATETRAKDLESETKSLKRENAHAKREIESLSKGALQLHEQLEQKGAAVTKKEQELKTTAKELQQQLAKMQNMVNIDDVENLKEEFFRNLQHESNTPMTAIITKSDILYDAYDTLDSNVIKDTIKDIVIGSERLKTYVNNLVDISKLKAAAGNELDKVHKVNLSNLVKDRTNHFKKIFSDDKHKAEFKLDIEQNLIVECNEYYITQLLDNLIINADTYGKNSVIEIHLKKMNSIMVEFKITDHGIGIPQEELNDVFKSFTTSSKTRTPAGGRGLGLALCQKVIEVHQGKILAESDDTNGTTFLFVIPFNYHYKDPELK